MIERIGCRAEVVGSAAVGHREPATVERDEHTGETFDPTRFLVGLADLLDAAASSPERRPAIELCVPQWMVCDWGVVTYNRTVYGLSLAQLRPSSISVHVKEKTWADRDCWDTARGVALALFPDWNHNPWLDPDGNRG